MFNEFVFFTSYTLEILDNPHVYQKEGYYPFKAPQSDISSPLYHERPYALINNKFGELQEVTRKIVLKVGGQKAIDMLKITHELSNLCNGMYPCLENMILNPIEKPHIYREKLQNIVNRVGSILF